jgi:predicted aspartyl protease
MPGGIGHIDKLGNACLNLHLCGVAHAAPGLEYTGIIDTGFTGFLLLPIQHAFALALPLRGTVSATLADGSQTSHLTAIVTATFGGQAEVGVATLAFNSNDILIGMDFLRRFGLAFLLSSAHVLLVDDSLVKDALEKAATPPKPPVPADEVAPPTGGVEPDPEAGSGSTAKCTNET